MRRESMKPKGATNREVSHVVYRQVMGGCALLCFFSFCDIFLVSVWKSVAIGWTCPNIHAHTKNFAIFKTSMWFPVGHACPGMWRVIRASLAVPIKHEPLKPVYRLRKMHIEGRKQQAHIKHKYSVIRVGFEGTDLPRCFHPSKWQQHTMSITSKTP
jgi:hypothetical protein